MAETKEAAAHTPGPWTVCAGYPTTVYAQCVPIASCSDGRGFDWLPGARFIYPENAEANARLIAAAPDMLAALRGVAHDLEELRGYLDGDPRDVATAEAIIDGRLAAGRAAIASAEGREP